ncbi:ATP-dependent DNA helicase pcrA [Arthrobacter agilis]|uniref:ATP-dependent helicase n=1 Tax=Arthrobacter agilis TaxID=37921 RepID=UPI000F6BCB66|nr:ATP-dependent DNA helicase [Arthrobacter agilis]VDR32775.1 ATP-dependent DNA helicase pcrA [Arthrobacter agilis]
MNPSTTSESPISPSSPEGEDNAPVLGRVRYSARRLAELLHADADSDVQYPTDEQARVIEAPLEPLLVIAGAGSGKTKTMADRVVWLVANGLVRPEQILGVTFTRKAAGELSSRVRQRLAQLYAARASAGVGGDTDVEDRLDPTISTYHSFANGIVQDYGLRIGVERDSVMLGTAQSWQLAHAVLEGYDGEWEHFTAAKSTLVKAVLGMAGECAEHLVAPSMVRQELRRTIDHVVGLPYVAGSTRPAAQKVHELLDKLRTRVTVTELVELYGSAKLARRNLDFGDLVSLAARIARDVPEAGVAERDKYRVVLLDEFQDTSHAQMVLFSRLFADGRSVTAVGDPHQSIYGFRGASAGQLRTFRMAFPRSSPDGLQPSSVAHLSVAWRNSTAILEAANTVSAPLNRAALWLRNTAVQQVPGLGARPRAPLGEVVLGRFLTDAPIPDDVGHGSRAGRTNTATTATTDRTDSGTSTASTDSRTSTASTDSTDGTDGGRSISEAEAVALEVLRQRRRSFEADDDGSPLRPTMAVLCRGRKQFEPIRRELERNGVPVQVVGLGGLLRTPEVVDLLATLRVLGDPDRSDSMLRLLAGARWRLGPADLMALGDWSKQLARTREAMFRRGTSGEQDPDEDQIRDLVVAPDLAEAGSLVEAVDHLPPADWVSSAGRSLSPVARERLDVLRRELRGLRAFVGDDLGTMIGEVERTMLLDIEVAAKPGVSIHEARRNLDAFTEAAAGFVASAERVDLAAFLSWLEAADQEEDGLPVTQLEASRDAVQLLTVHASKGLEWDVVFVPGLNEKSFPSGKDSRWSSGDAAIPWPLRGDAAELPQWDWEQPDQKQWLTSEKEFADDAKVHAEREERRLAYVAFTRAKHVLVCTSSAWGGGRSRPSAPSSYLMDLLTIAGSGAPGFSTPHWLEDGAEGETNPAISRPERGVWPFDPLGARRDDLERAARAVLEQAAEPTPGVEVDDGRWGREVRLLLARQARERERLPLVLPAHISASTLVQLGEDPEAVLEQLRRPLPRRPGSAARKGTAFHAWIEEFYGSGGMLDLGEYPGGADAHVDETLGLQEMADIFERSEWALREPFAVEAPIETKIGGVVVRGRIDAVFRDADGGWDLIDWKTGRPPGREQREAKAVQLAVYRLAWSRLKEVPLDTVRAAFFYVADNLVVRPHDLAEADELEAIIGRAHAATGRPF